LTPRTAGRPRPLHPTVNRVRRRDQRRRPGRGCCRPPPRPTRRLGAGHPGRRWCAAIRSGGGRPGASLPGIGIPWVGVCVCVCVCVCSRVCISALSQPSGRGEEKGTGSRLASRRLASKKTRSLCARAYVSASLTPRAPDRAGESVGVMSCWDEGGERA